MSVIENYQRVAGLLLPRGPPQWPSAAFRFRVGAEGAGGTVGLCADAMLQGVLGAEKVEDAAWAKGSTVAGSPLPILMQLLEGHAFAGTAATGDEAVLAIASSEAAFARAARFGGVCPIEFM